MSGKNAGSILHFDQHLPIRTSEISSSSLSVPIRDVDAVIGGKAELPCPIEPADDVYLVLWYRREAGKPLYR